MNRNRFLLLFFTLITYEFAYSLQINEVMQSDLHSVIDDLNEIPDSWVELYNETSSPINLKGYAIGQTPQYSSSYVIQDSLIIESNGYVLLYCDKENKGVHTNFRLNSDEYGELYLFDSTSNIVDFLAIPAMPAPDISYGKIKETDTWSYFREASPNRSNDGVYSDYVLSKVKFSKKGGVYTEPVVLKLSLDKDDEELSGKVQIRYTIDGSEPTDSSALFPDSLFIDKTVVIRAKTFSDSLISKPSKTQSYIFLNRKMTLPVFSIAVDSSYLWDDEIGILADGTYHQNHPEKKPEYVMKGNDTTNFTFSWKRPINVEYFSKPNSESEINQICEMNLGGRSSRFQERKSFVLHANKRFGTKRFSGSFWDEKPNVTKEKTLYLRNGGGDFPRAQIRDGLEQQSFAKHVDLDWQAFQTVIVYVNGVYWGLLNLREKATEDYVWANYNHIENIDYVKNHSLDYGDPTEWNRFVKLYSSDTTSYETMCKELDVNEFLNYFALESLYNNIDFPGNNNKCWRQQGSGHKWRFLACDLDYTMGLTNLVSYDFAYLNYILRVSPYESAIGQNTKKGSMLFQKMMSYEVFKNAYIDRMSVYMATFVSPANFNKELQTFVDEVKEEAPYYFVDVLNRSTNSFENACNYKKIWMKNRVPFMYKHIGEFFSLGEPISLKIKNVGSKDSIFFNDIPLYENSFDGSYYANRQIRLTQKNVSNSWSVKYSMQGDSIVYEYFPKIDTLFYSIPDGASNVVIKNGLASSLTYPKKAECVKMYDGKPLCPTIKVKDNNIKILYSIDGGENWMADAPSITNRGVLDVKVKSIFPGADVIEYEYVLEITAAEIELHCPSADSTSKVYDGQPMKFDVKALGVESTDTIIVEYSVDSCLSWCADVPEITDKGELEVKVRANHPNYDSARCNYKMTVTEAPLSVAWRNENFENLIDGEETVDPLVIVEGAYDRDQITIEYSIDGGIVWTTDVNALKQATDSVLVRAIHPNYEIAECKYLVPVVTSNMDVKKVLCEDSLQGDDYKVYDVLGKLVRTQKTIDGLLDDLNGVYIIYVYRGSKVLSFHRVLIKKE